MLKRVYLEITNACNLNCSFCRNKKGNNYLGLEEIELYIKQIKKHCDYIYLHIIGEPTMHPHFEEILCLLDSYDMKLQLVTNGTLLYKYPNIFFHKCLRKLSISMHSTNNLNNDSYLKNIYDIINNENKTNIELRFYDYDNLSDDLKDFLEKIKKEFKYEKTSKNNSYKIKNNVYVYFENLFKWPNINDKYISSQGTCHGAIDIIAINSSSEVTICCLDPKAHNSIGNLKNESLDNILQSKKYLDIIKEFKNNKISLELCSKCSYRLRFK